MRRYLFLVFTALLTSCSAVQVETPVLTEEATELETLLLEMPWVSTGMAKDIISFMDAG